jgi:predicted transcriptional regulator YdeE
MKKELVTRPEIKLVGLSVRTNNQAEMNPETAKIGALLGQFWSMKIAEQLTKRVNPGVSLAVYTDYESDEHGNYTYFIGEEVSSFEKLPSDLQRLIIPATQYQRFTTAVGSMPGIVIQAWQQIWQMTAEELGGRRVYQADFELYDQRASDLSKASLDIYIGIE